MAQVFNHLIVDAGATKTHFVLLCGGKVVAEHKFAGINANYSDNSEITGVFSSAVSALPRGMHYDRIDYYGAGCATPLNASRISGLLQLFFPLSDICVHSDLLAACRALAGRETAIVCILGTGSTSCLYDGNDMAQRAPSLGYLLGDEASGTHLGKMIIKEYLSHNLPPDIESDLETTYNLSVESTLRKLYQEDHPNRFLASLPPFLSKYKNNEVIKDILSSSFEEFFNTNRKYYDGIDQLSWHFTGSIAEHFREELCSAAKKTSCKIGNIVADPMPLLIKYHSA